MSETLAQADTAAREAASHVRTAPLPPAAVDALRRLELALAPQTAASKAVTS